jgi:hypothetical protein
LTKQELSNSDKYLVMSPRWGSTPIRTDRLTVGRNVTLTLTSIQNIVAHLLKARTVKPAETVGNRHMIAERVEHATIEELWKQCGPS